MIKFLKRSVISLAMVLFLCCSNFAYAVGDGISGESSASVSFQQNSKKEFHENTHLLNILIYGEDGELNEHVKRAICAKGESIESFQGVDLNSDDAQRFGLSKDTVVVQGGKVFYYAINIRDVKKIGDVLDEVMIRSCHYVMCPLKVNSNDEIENIKTRGQKLFDSIRKINKYCEIYFVLVCDRNMYEKERFNEVCGKFEDFCSYLQKSDFSKGRQAVGCIRVIEENIDLQKFWDEDLEWAVERIDDVEKHYEFEAVDLDTLFELPKKEPRDYWGREGTMISCVKPSYEEEVDLSKDEDILSSNREDGKGNISAYWGPPIVGSSTGKESGSKGDSKTRLFDDEKIKRKSRWKIPLILGAFEFVVGLVCGVIALCIRSSSVQSDSSSGVDDISAVSWLGGISIGLFIGSVVCICVGSIMYC